MPRGLPLFESLVVFENFPLGALNSRGAESSEESQSTGDYQFVSQTDAPLHLRVRLGQRIMLDLIYDQTRFSSEAMTVVLEQLEHLMEQFVADPEQLVSRLALWSEPQRRRISTSTGSIAPDNNYPVFAAEAIEQTIARRFEEQVRRAPEQIAIQTASEQIPDHN